MIAVPSFNELIASQRVQMAAMDVFTSLLRARSEAIKQNTDVTLSPAGTWTAGWTVAVGGTNIETHAATNNISISDPGVVTYRSSGTGRRQHQAQVLGFRDIHHREALRKGQLEWRAGCHQWGVLMNDCSAPQRNRERGVSLLEALITIFILAFGMLGLANLNAKMQTVEVESYARSQALILLDDMAARLSAHRGVAATYVTSTPPVR